MTNLSTLLLHPLKRISTMRLSCNQDLKSQYVRWVSLFVTLCMLLMMEFCIVILFSFTINTSFCQVLQASAEADTFFCFVELIGGFRDNFVQKLDNSVVGIRSTITRLSQLLKEHDEELWRHLEMTTKVRNYISTLLLHGKTIRFPFLNSFVCICRSIPNFMPFGG